MQRSAYYPERPSWWPTSDLAFVGPNGFKPCSQVAPWSSSGSSASQDLAQSLLHLYESGAIYDCTFKVGFKQTGYKNFKCHKAILASSSPFFMQTFNDNLKEPGMFRDEPIILDRVSPSAFDFAMRQVYGARETCQHLQFAISVYKLAHELKITSLLQQLTSRLSYVTADEVMAVVDLLKMLNVQDDLYVQCLHLIQAQPDRVLASDSWLNASKDSVQQVLLSYFKRVSSFKLVKALLSWSQHNADECATAAVLVKSVGLSCEQVMKLNLTPREFAMLCQMGLEKVFGHKERCQIFMELSLVTHRYSPCYNTW